MMFFNETNQHVKNIKNVILAGDFNMVEELRNRQGGNINNSHLIDLNAIKKLKNDHNLHTITKTTLEKVELIAFTNPKI